MIGRLGAAAMLAACAALWATSAAGFLYWVGVHKVCGNVGECAHA